MKKSVALLVLLLLGLFVPGAAALNVVTTMPNLWNVADEIGGDTVTVMYIAPPDAIHISSDTIEARLQQNSEFIKTADVFLGQGGGMDKIAITKVTEFRKKNFDEDTNWLLLANVSKKDVPNATITFDNPFALRGYSEAVAYLLGTADPAHASIYQDKLQKYLTKVADATKLSADEKGTLADIPILCHFRIKNQAVSWLGMNCIGSYPQPTAVKDLIDDIHADPKKYKAIAENAPIGKILVIENSVAGPKMGIGIHEALNSEGIPCERVIFLNLPKSAENVDSILDYYAHNKNLILPQSLAGATSAPTQTPLGVLAVGAGISGAVLICKKY
ncbi:MAG TPA: zinc ABC transporter substrate-binding protein [Methanocorpusculum sp.]|nr:zinc ABC transporter substrate-binding protein [Methanocorpusculum sp.]